MVGLIAVFIGVTVYTLFGLAFAFKTTVEAAQMLARQTDRPK